MKLRPVAVMVSDRTSVKCSRIPFGFKHILIQKYNKLCNHNIIANKTYLTTKSENILLKSLDLIQQGYSLYLKSTTSDKTLHSGDHYSTPTHGSQSS